jgi:O-acetyl-ADP-ribose deacetylase (regulator of RNase III)
MVHVAVPPYMPQRPEDFRLAAAYRAMLDAADELGGRTLAVTPFGLTLPYWPIDTATRVALGTLRNSGCRVRETTLVVRTAAALDVLAEALARL